MIIMIVAKTTLTFCKYFVKIEFILGRFKKENIIIVLVIYHLKKLNSLFWKQLVKLMITLIHSVVKIFNIAKAKISMLDVLLL